jgi:outer membrane protein assembly factor BamB
MKTHAAIALAACLLTLAPAAHGDDWPQWRGPNRDGVSREKGLLKEWPKGGPKLLWTFKDAGGGYSQPAIVGDRLYLSGARGDSEYLFAVDLTKTPPVEAWAVKIGPTFTWQGNNWNEGPSAAPTVDGDLVFALGGNGELVCVDGKGNEKWRTNLPKNLDAEVNPIGGSPEKKLGWGFAAAPLVDGDKLICVPGGPKGTVAALDKRTGAVLWRSKELTEQASYSAPVAAEIAGVKQYVVMTNAGVAGVGTDGKLLWNYKRKKRYADIIACTPIVHKDQVFVSAAGSGGSSELLKVEKGAGGFTVTRAWESKDLQNFHGGVVLVDGYLYGASGDFGRSSWVCLNMKDGKSAWDEDDRDLGKGSLAYADGCLYCLGEKSGVVKLAEASPKELTVKGDLQLPDASKLRKGSGGFWTHPAIANGRLYLRDQELLYCYQIK